MSALRVRLHIATLMLASTVGGASVSSAQVPPRRLHTDAVRDALDLGARNRFDDAVERLTATQQECSTTGDAPSCERLVLRSLGYLYQVQAEREPGRRTQLLDEASQYYRAVVDSDPAQVEAVYNLSLVLRAMGPHEWQEPYFRAAPEWDPARRLEHLLFLGEYYARQQGRVLQAVGAYEAALALEPRSRAAASALIALYEQGAGVPAERLMEHAATWEIALPDVALEAYLTMIEGTHSVRPATADDALVRFVGLAAQQDRLDRETLSALPREWPALRELVGFLERGCDAAGGDWWVQDEARRRSLATVALSTGRRLVAEGSPERAETCWRNGTRFVEPNHREALDLKRELALLYFRHRELDPGGDRFRALEHELFVEKTGFLEAQDHAAAQRYHTTLGLIYAERGDWRGPRARNAVDQLTWAVNAAERVDRQTGGHRPVPELRSLLATGLESLGGVEQARQLHFEAAVGFLDTDAVGDAAMSLERAGTGRASAPLVDLIRVRQRLQRSGGNTPATSDPTCEPGRIRAATDGVRSVIGQPFADRQTLKLFADCAAIAGPGRKVEYDTEVFDLAVRLKVPLVGTEDLLRFQRAWTTVVGAVDIAAPVARVEYDVTGRSTEGVRLTLPGDPRPAVIPVPDSLATAVQVLRLLGPRAESVRFRLEGGTLSLDPEQARLVSPALRAELARLEGIRTVRVAPVARRRTP